MVRENVHCGAIECSLEHSEGRLEIPRQLRVARREVAQHLLRRMHGSALPQLRELEELEKRARHLETQRTDAEREPVLQLFELAGLVFEKVAQPVGYGSFDILVVTRDTKAEHMGIGAGFI